MSHTLSVLVENKPGVLARISGLISRRGFNIESLAVGQTEDPEISRMTIVVDVEAIALEQVTKQLNKLVEVIKVVQLEADASVQREVLLIKVRCDSVSRAQILQLVEVFRANVIDLQPDSVIIQTTGARDKVAAFVLALEPYGVRELVQSGVIAMGRGPRSITDRALRSA
ncbi:acetolactate synthase small subunit [Dermacoccaceae bacterium W4C1]